MEESTVKKEVVEEVVEIETGLDGDIIIEETDIPERLGDEDTDTYTFYTPALIADILDEAKHVISNLIRMMEAENILSTSNKESGTHRKLNANDFEKIKNVIEGNRKMGISYKAGIAALKYQQETGTTNSIQDLYMEQKKTNYNLEYNERALTVINKAIIQQSQNTREAILKEQNESEFRIRHQIETGLDEQRKMMEDQRKIIEEQFNINKDLVNEIAELKEKLEQKEEKPKKKFLGLF